LDYSGGNGHEQNNPANILVEESKIQVDNIKLNPNRVPTGDLKLEKNQTNN
jgi:hypothetical protein